jgi:phage I-like protein
MALTNTLTTAPMESSIRISLENFELALKSLKTLSAHSANSSSVAESGIQALQSALDSQVTNVATKPVIYYSEADLNLLVDGRHPSPKEVVTAIRATVAGLTARVAAL